MSKTITAFNSVTVLNIHYLALVCLCFAFDKMHNAAFMLTPKNSSLQDETVKNKR